MKADKTKEQLINELAEMRQGISELEEKYRFLYEDSPAINMIIGTDGVIKDVNGILIRKYGFTKDDIIGKHTLKFVISDQREKVAAQLRRDFKEEFTSEIEVDIYAKDRSIHTILFSEGNLILKEKSQPIGILVTGIDITERKRAEEKIKAKSLFLESLIQQSPLPTFVMDSKGFVMMVNEAFLKFYAVPNKEMILGRNAITEPANVKQGMVKYFKEALSGKIVKTPEIEFVSPYKNKKTITRSRMFPILDTAGTLTNVVVIQEDITERKLADEALRKSEERFRFMAENTGDVLYRLRYDTMAFDYLNPAVSILTGYTAEEINKIGFKSLIKQMVIPGTPDILPEELTKKRKEGKTVEWRAEYEILTKDGEEKWLGDHSFPWKDDSGKIVGSTGILQDITKHKQAEEQLQERLQELEIYYNATMGREGRIIELKQQVNELFVQLGKEKKYDV